MPEEEEQKKDSLGGAEAAGKAPKDGSGSGEKGLGAPEKEEAGKAKPEEELRERLLRLAAEFDNYKKRTAKDIENAKNIGKAEMALKLLPALDESELALNALGEKGAKEGIGMVLANLTDALKGLGLVEVDAHGTFDPYRHEIVLARESEKKEGTILEVVRKGYELNGIMLRPASVIVSKGTAEAAGRKEEKLQQEQDKL
jgi:molecular chaperone GrpE